MYLITFIYFNFFQLITNVNMVLDICVCPYGRWTYLCSKYICSL